MFERVGGKSFKAPTLNQQYQASQLSLIPASSVIGTPASRTLFLMGGGNSELGPERAETFTAGLVLHPEAFPGFSFDVGWFDTKYTDRVVNPISPTSQALTNPAFAAFVTLNPSMAQLNEAFARAGLSVGTFTFNITGGPYNASSVYAILDNRFTNASRQDIRGVDITLKYSGSLFGGRLHGSANAAWLESTRQLTPSSSELRAAGVIYFPPKFRARLGGSWNAGGLTLAVYANHLAGVKSTNSTPNPEGASMTTIDSAIEFQRKWPFVGHLVLNLAVTNIFDRRPPFLQPLQPYLVNFDSTNYSAVGRLVVVSMRVVHRS
jgi:outer membrane receptor protein involved in Fe transport